MKPVSFVTPTVHCFHGQMALIVCTDLFFFLDLVPHEAVGQVRKTALPPACRATWAPLN